MCGHEPGEVTLIFRRVAKEYCTAVREKQSADAQTDAGTNS